MTGQTMPGEHSGKMFEVLYERSPIGMALLRPDGTFVRCNSAFQRITGYTLDELACMSEAALSAPGSTAADAHAQALLREGGAVAPYEKEYIARGGIRVPVRVSGVAVSEPGTSECVWWIAEDITTRRQMMDALKRSEAEARMLSAAASHTGNMVVITDPAGRIEWVNDAFESTTGFSRAEVVGRTAGSVLHGPDTDVETRAQMRAAIAAGEPFSVEVVNYGKGGTRYWVAIECAPVFDHLGRLERFVAIERDVTDQKEAARALSESEEKYRRVFENAREVIWQFDRDGVITMLNPAWERLTGRLVADSIGHLFFDHLVAEQRASALVALEELMSGRVRVFDQLGCFTTQSGEPRWVEIRAQIYHDQDGAPVCMGTLHDVHERRRAEAGRRAAEEALRETQERYQRAIESASDVIWERDLASGRFYVSERMCDILRIDVATAAESRNFLFMMVHPDDLEMHCRNIEAMNAGDETIAWEARFRTGDGGYRWLRVRGRTVRDAAGKPVLMAGTASDVDDARLASEELRAMQVRYARALEGASDGIWERTLASDQFYFSDRFDEILGYVPGGVPRARKEWLTLIHPDDLATHLAGVEEMIGGERAVMWEVRFKSAAGGYRWLRMRGIAVRNAHGEVVMTSGTASDVHAAKCAEDELKRHRDNLAELVRQRTLGLEVATNAAQAERAKAEAARELAESARQTAVAANLAKSDFLANMSHELRTPMHAIISFANFGVEKIDRVETARLLHYFRNIQKSGSRLLSLLNDLLDLSKLEAGKMEMQRQAVDVGAMVADALAEAEALARARRIRLVMRAAGEVRASIDSMRMLQVLRNLLSNAIKFTPECGYVEVTCRVVGEGGPGPSESYIEILVRDTGVGIPEAELEAVFDKFVQSSKTKTGAGGTGLGLAICREILAAHGGSVHARNNAPPQAGATFVVRLPLVERIRPAHQACVLS